MKTMILISGILLAAATLGHSQLTLNTGETWTYQFSSLPSDGLINALTTNLGGGFWFQINSGSFQSGDLLRYEMFENSAAEAPISSGTLAAPPSMIVGSFNLGAWQDVQGAVRLTMLAGSVTVDTVYLRAITPSPSLSSYNLYDTFFVPVPEPTVLGLLAAGGGVGVLRFAFRKRRIGRRVAQASPPAS